MGALLVWVIVCIKWVYALAMNQRGMGRCQYYMSHLYVSVRELCEWRMVMNWLDWNGAMPCLLLVMKTKDEDGVEWWSHDMPDDTMIANEPAYENG